MEHPGLNSFSLLRLSITRSIESRYYEIKPPENHVPKRKKHRKYKEPRSDASLMDAHVAKSTLPASFAEKSEMLPDETFHVKIEDTLGKTKNTPSQKEFTRLLSKSGSSGEFELVDKQNLQRSESIELKERKRHVKNGLNLARRKFSDGLYENCSTYNLEYSGISLDKEEISSPDAVLAHLNPNNHAVSRLSGLKDVKNKENNHKIHNIEDPVSLGDSFFSDVTKDESSSGDSYFRRRTIPQLHYESNKNMASKESAQNVSTTDITYDKYTGAHIHQSRERKSSRKYRKRQKNKNKNSLVYKCPTCSVSYILSPNALKSTARCLHCDFWTTVEPVFLKQEKIPWNICQIS